MKSDCEDPTLGAAIADCIDATGSNTGVSLTRAGAAYGAALEQAPNADFTSLDPTIPQNVSRTAVNGSSGTASQNIFTFPAEFEGLEVSFIVGGWTTGTGAARKADYTLADSGGSPLDSGQHDAANTDNLNLPASYNAPITLTATVPNDLILRIDVVRDPLQPAISLYMSSIQINYTLPSPSAPTLTTPYSNVITKVVDSGETAGFSLYTYRNPNIASSAVIATDFWGGIRKHNLEIDDVIFCQLSDGLTKITMTTTTTGAAI